MGIAVLVSPNAIPCGHQQQQAFERSNRRVSGLVRRRKLEIRQARDVFDQLVEGGRRLGIGEESTDLVGTTKPACLLAHEDRARGDWLGKRGDAIERIGGCRASRSNLSASSFENDLPVLADGYRACGVGRDRQGVE